MFAKLFDTEQGQILVKLDDAEDGEPEVRFYVQPAGMGVCSLAITFPGKDGFSSARRVFEGVTLGTAVAAVASLHQVAGPLLSAHATVAQRA